MACQSGRSTPPSRLDTFFRVMIHVQAVKG